jgi:hypothetical protein
MGVCSCKDLIQNYRTNVDVDNLDKNILTPKMTVSNKILKVKSIKFSNPEFFRNYTKVSEFLENEENKIFERLNSKMGKKTDNIPTNLQDFESTDQSSKLIQEHQITEKEQDLIKKALGNHFLFKDVNEEIL